MICFLSHLKVRIFFPYLLHNSDYIQMHTRTELVFSFSVGWLTTGKKDKMSEVERQLKKAEAAQRRKVKLENAAREAEVWPLYHAL